MPNLTHKTLRARKLTERTQRGQALVILAAAFVGLAAFIGLTVDAGILFSNIGHLRRATDAAVLAAANQFREGWDPPDLASEALEMLELNGIDGGIAEVYVCDLSNNPGAPLFPGYHDVNLCPGKVYPLDISKGVPRKVVRVVSYVDVDFAFLPIIGFSTLRISANAESEAASLDLVLALDVSESMAVDLCDDDEDNDGDGHKDAADCKGAVGTEPFEDDVQACLDATAASHYPYPPEPFDIEAVFPNECHPFESVRYSAHRLVDRMYFPYDRLSIVTFGRTATRKLELDDTDDLPAGCSPTDPKACAHKVLDDLRVELSPQELGLCTVGTPSGCMSTNIGDGLLAAGGRFCVDDDPKNDFCDRTEMREEAVWIVILLTDGAANAGIGDGDPNDVNAWFCPENTFSPLATPGAIGPEKEPPYCRDIDPDSRHVYPDPDYFDADDYARDMADAVGCPGKGVILPPGSGCPADPDGGAGAVIFTIGLGDFVTANPEDTANPRAGELLLRYAADVGIDGEPKPPELIGQPPDPFDCYPDPPTGENCGNYYFAPKGDDLIAVFEDIASRIFTRITH